MNINFVSFKDIMNAIRYCNAQDITIYDIAILNFKQRATFSYFAKFTLFPELST